MQGSSRIKIHQKPNQESNRKCKGKKKPQALRQAKSRRSSFKKQLGI